MNSLSACHIEIVIGMPEHVHSLFLLNPKKTIIEVLQQVKGGSSHTITHNNLIAEKFSWQTGYAAFSVSESAVEKVYSYIKNQKLHHTKRTFAEEYDEFLKLAGFILPEH